MLPGRTYRASGGELQSCWSLQQSSAIVHAAIKRSASALNLLPNPLPSHFPLAPPVSGIVADPGLAYRDGGRPALGGEHSHSEQPLELMTLPAPLSLFSQHSRHIIMPASRRMLSASEDMFLPKFPVLYRYLCRHPFCSYRDTIPHRTRRTLLPLYRRYDLETYIICWRIRRCPGHDLATSAWWLTKVSRCLLAVFSHLDPTRTTPISSISSVGMCLQPCGAVCVKVWTVGGSGLCDLIALESRQT